VDAILAGQRDGAELAKLRDPHIKADADTIRKSLEGNWRPEHLFTLGQSRDLYRIYQQQIVNCDLEIEKMLQQFEPRTDPAQRPLPPDRKRNRAGSKRRKKNGHPHPEFDLRTETYKLFGVDVTQIPGLEENALPLFSEVGRDMSTWPSAAHFISWLALCPDNDISGGKLLWRGARKVKNRAGHLFRLAAFSLHHSLTPLARMSHSGGGEGRKVARSGDGGRSSSGNHRADLYRRSCWPSSPQGFGFLVRERHTVPPTRCARATGLATSSLSAAQSYNLQLPMHLAK
jgi:hypothetical protein